MAARWLCWALLLLLPAPLRAAGPGPVLLNRPFVTVWNIPSEPCAQQYNISLDLRVFDVVANAGEAFTGQDITLFYSSRLGLFPYYTAQGQPVNGGLPQNASLAAHLQRARRDITAALPSAVYDGLAVVDWEQWRPLWDRDWGSMDIYRQKSEQLVQQQHPLWPSSRVEEVAQQQYQEAARAFMEWTLQLGEAMRPGGYWGFYGFPDCYNNNFSNPLYNGSCPAVEQQRNRELGWLWNCSRALYPSIYVPQQLQGTDKVLRYVRYRVAEAFAVQKGVLSTAVPVLPYTEIIYDKTSDFLSEDDLVNTIGESAAQGAAGIIIWGSSNDTSSKEKCLKLRDYLDVSLGRYIVNVTASAQLCSQSLCSGNGRCVRREGKLAFLQLDPSRFAINPKATKPQAMVWSLTANGDASQLAEDFSCQCYSGWQGEQCDSRAPPHK
ncbi:hyaluronidase-1 [Cyrtonyx montezumae]|uniref:hyaluronidase-1 n=1 Tax=Cyrtonyx montezumae TaxID=9017 RepID=UPI0032DB6694